MSVPKTPTRDSVLDLLRNIQGAQFVIPVYQRNYTWIDKKHVKQLLDDLKLLLDGTYQKHFLGIMIYLEKPISLTHRELSVIDGQQRLTTIFLMLYVIRDLLCSDNREKEATDIERNYLLNLVSETEKYKLKPLVSDDDVYKQIIDGKLDAIQQKESNVYKSYIYIKKEFSILNDAYDFNDILAAINKMYLVCVPIYEDDYPQRIFESINATGVPLTASDLIRNYLLMPENSTDQDAFYKKYWKKIEDLISSDSKELENFFRFFVIAKELDTVNKNATYRSFTKWHKAHFEELNSEGIFNEIIKYAIIYNQIYKCPADQIQPELRDAIVEYRKCGSDMPTALIMELMVISGNKQEFPNTIKTEDLAGIIDILNSYIMRRALCGMDTSDISRYFPDLLRSLLSQSNGNYATIVELFKKQLINGNKGTAREMPDDKTVRERIRFANMYSLREWVSIFLQKLEMKDNPAPVDFSKLSIEHLMPQKPSVTWLRKLKITDDEYGRHLHRLGNLTFAAKTDNSRMQNKEWNYKKMILAGTEHIKINQGLFDIEDWNIQCIENRTNFLIDKIIELYPYYTLNVSNTYIIPIYISDNNAYVIGTLDLKSFVVNIEKYSILSSKPSESLLVEPWIADWRQDLLDKGILIVNADGELEFCQAYSFVAGGRKENIEYFMKTSSLILAQPAPNPFVVWHTEDGMTLIDYLVAHESEITTQLKFGNDEIEHKQKKANLKFSALGISTGEKLIFNPTGITVTVCSDNKISYNGEEYKLSPFVRKFIPDDMRNQSDSYQGGKYFSYEGKILTDIRNDKDIL